MKILLVDDEENIRKLVHYNLILDGYDVIMAVNGKEGLEKAIQEKPDLILLDIMMPEMDGLEVCSRLKKNPETRDIPIFMLSAKGQMQDLEDAYDVGADNYITKPFDVDKLSEIIQFKLKKLKEKK
ncbi:MAG: two-component system, OmpR family, alkaline phosphatase synthesis response regulator PhoP [Candidatus Marinimicrobia bacterium]|jgi:two-component system alkaline phosphatase synthesis response regulator PhoP|nr:two-component system, OmpR family, alkaline phosphatase synthesis response regulator PhoP [Candidatus Neomarinimicrobiota bacterium]